MRGKHPDAVPLVELGAAPMKTKFGNKSKPTLKVVGWQTTEASVVIEQPKLPPIAKDRSSDMDDDIPF